MTKRFVDLDYCHSIEDKVTGRVYSEYDLCNGDVTRLLNWLSDRADKILEIHTTNELLKLRWEHDIYEKYVKEISKIMEKYEIESLEKLDQILFNQKIW